MARILLADDDAATRDLVRRALRGGWPQRARHAGRQRSARMRRGSAQKFDVLVSDVEMPLLDGVALAQRALKQPNLRVLLMSGFAEQLDRAKSLKSARVAVLSKPFSLEDVRASVRKLLA